MANGRMPFIENRPKLGLNPVTPQYDAGLSTEPLSACRARDGTMPAATAAAEPLDSRPVCDRGCADSSSAQA